MKKFLLLFAVLVFFLVLGCDGSSNDVSNDIDEESFENDYKSMLIEMYNDGVANLDEETIENLETKSLSDIIVSFTNEEDYTVFYGKFLSLLESYDIYADDLVEEEMSAPETKASGLSTSITYHTGGMLQQYTGIVSFTGTCGSLGGTFFAGSYSQTKQSSTNMLGFFHVYVGARMYHTLHGWTINPNYHSYAYLY